MDSHDSLILLACDKESLDIQVIPTWALYHCVKKLIYMQNYECAYAWVFLVHCPLGLKEFLHVLVYVCCTIEVINLNPVTMCGPYIP